MKVLAVFPESSLRNTVQGVLAANHIVSDDVVSLNECLRHAQLDRYDAILIDSTLFAFQDVLAVADALRRSNHEVSLFIWRLYADLEERKWLYEAGVDDCISEPFIAAELAFRLRRLIELRQAASKRRQTESVILRTGDLELNLIRRTATRSKKVIDLRPKEFLLLEYLMRNVNRPVTRTMIMEQVWHAPYYGLTNVVDVYVSSLRHKVDQKFPEKLIKTIHRQGYVLSVTGEEQRETSKCAQKGLL